MRLGVDLSGRHGNERGRLLRIEDERVHFHSGSDELGSQRRRIEDHWDAGCGGEANPTAVTDLRSRNRNFSHCCTGSRWLRTRAVNREHGVVFDDVKSALRESRMLKHGDFSPQDDHRNDTCVSIRDLAGGKTGSKRGHGGMPGSFDKEPAP